MIIHNNFKDFSDFYTRLTEVKKEQYPDSSTIFPKRIIFRGQENSNWGIISNFDRIFGIHDQSEFENIPEAFKIQNIKRLSPETYKETKDGIIKRYIENIRKVEGSKLDNMNETDILIHGRHFGLLTDFIDFTHNPFVAIYFAIEKYLHGNFFKINLPKLLRNNGGENLGAIFKITEFQNDLSESNVEYFENSHSAFTRPFNQSGCFIQIVDSEEVYLEETLNKYHKGNILEKFIIPSSILPELILQLELLNINALTLFPDPEGCAKYANGFGMNFHLTNLLATKEIIEKNMN